MFLLTTTTQIVRVTTSTAATVDVTASYIDQTGAVFAPGAQATAISSATTTTVVSAPAASTTRIVKLLTIRNRDTSLSSTISVSRYDGITSTAVYQVTLPAGGEAIYSSKLGWTTVATPASVTVQLLTAAGTGTYYTPSGVRSLQIECVGGGGSGGSANSTAAGGGGGGSGAYVRSFIAEPSASYTYVVGAGGAAANPTFDGSAGASTQFGASVIAAGGSGGKAGVPGTGAAGGLASASTGTLKVNGKPGTSGNSASPALANAYYNGMGGSSMFCGAANVMNSSLSRGGAIPGTLGAGGSGGMNNQGSGAGGDGVIRITEYR